MRQTPSKQQSTHLKTDCIGECYRMNGYCTGCGRTSEEIFDWIILTDEQKQAILASPREDAKKD